VEPQHLTTEINCPGPDPGVRGDGDPYAGGGQFVGERLGERRVGDNASDVREDILRGNLGTKEAGECRGQARRQVGGAVRMEEREGSAALGALEVVEIRD
jgi:hypothetical protein